MALNIENASFGYDANNLQQAINNLNTKCVTSTIASIKTGLAELRRSVDAAWAGQSAEKFKTKMEEDADIVSKAIEEAGESVIASLKSYLGSLAEVDESITF